MKHSVLIWSVFSFIFVNKTDGKKPQLYSFGVALGLGYWLSQCQMGRLLHLTCVSPSSGCSAGVTQYFTSHPLHLPDNGTLPGSKMAPAWPPLTSDMPVFQSSVWCTGKSSLSGFYPRSVLCPGKQIYVDCYAPNTHFYKLQLSYNSDKKAFLTVVMVIFLPLTFFQK